MKITRGVTRKYKYHVWLTAEEVKAIGNPEPGSDVDYTHAILFRDLMLREAKRIDGS